MSTTQQPDHVLHRVEKVETITMMQLDDEGRETSTPRAIVAIYRCTRCGKSGVEAWGHGTFVGVTQHQFGME